MNVTLNWLKQYVDFDWSADQLAERLTMLGLEVEGVRRLSGEFAGVVVAQVITRDKHPNADKLSLCRVNDGQGERQIVCGAQNFQAGDKVPLILPGHTLPAQPGQPPFTIKVGKIRGVESHGMLCSPKELGLADDAQGLMILRPDAPVGRPFAAYLGRSAGDVVFDLEVTPNRPDLNSVIGIARELAALTGNPLRLPEIALPPTSPDAGRADQLVAVRLDDPDLCPRYTARVLRGVRVGPSPDWMRTWIERVGLRSINNVVDATNFVMLEVGQPLHAFDYHLIARGPAAPAGTAEADPDRGSLPTIVVRRAQPSETFVTLDGQSHVLTAENLLIADEQKGIALAGVMGGQNSEINERTVDVLLESAYFKPSNIRRTSKALGLRTDASYRFERGADLGVTDWASMRCAQLILETAGGCLASGVVAAYPKPFEPRQVTLRHAKVNELLGITLEPAEIEYYLGQLGLKITGRKPRPVGEAGRPEPVAFVIPSFRVDLKREADLIEEVCRLHGVEKIPAAPPRGATGTNDYDAVHDQLAEVRRLLTGLGLDEAQGQTLISDAAAALVLPPSPASGDAVPPGLVALGNPLSSDMNVLRPSLLPGLLDSLRHNLSRQNLAVALFEVGRVFLPAAASVGEHRRVALALTGRRQPTFWSGTERDAKCDAADLKGVLEEFLEHFGVRGVTHAPRAQSTVLFIESAAVLLGGKLALGEWGQLHPVLARRYDLRDPVFLAELDLSQILLRRHPARTFKPLPAFPSIRRDLALVVAESVTHDAVLAAVRQARAQNLEAVELFDVFRGKNIAPGQKSLAYAFTFRSSVRRRETDAEAGLESLGQHHRFEAASAVAGHDAQRDHPAELGDLPAEQVGEEAEQPGRQQPPLERLDRLVEVRHGEQKPRRTGRALNQLHQALDQQRLEPRREEIDLPIGHRREPPVVLPGRVVDLLDLAEVGLECLLGHGAEDQLGIAFPALLGQTVQPLERALPDIDEEGEQVLGLPETQTLDEGRVVARVVRHHERRIHVEPLDEQPALVVAGRVHRAKDVIQPL